MILEKSIDKLFKPIMNDTNSINYKHVEPYNKQYKKVTKRQLYNSFLLFLDEVLPKLNCDKVIKEGNYKCSRCDICMMNQYITKTNKGELPKILKGV